MKRTTTNLLAIISLSIFFMQLSSSGLAQGNQTNMVQIKTDIKDALRSSNTSALFQVQAKLERLIVMNQKNWLAHFYSGYSKYLLAVRSEDKVKQIDLLNSALESLETCVNINDKFQESYIVISNLYGMKIGIERSNAIVYSSKAKKAIESAEKINSENPRLLLSKGQTAVYTPAQYGGGLELARVYLTKSIELFEQYHLESEDYPDWGKEEALFWLGYISDREAKYLEALKYYKKSLSINPEYKLAKESLAALTQKLTVEPNVSSDGGMVDKSNVMALKVFDDYGATHYTVDGTEPDANSPLYSKPISISGPTNFKFKKIYGSGLVSETKIVRFEDLLFSPPVAEYADDFKDGLKYTFYEGDWQKLPDFSKIQSSKESFCKKIELPTGEDHFGAIFEGFLLVPQTGTYTFFLTSDDGSKLHINDKLIINNDGLHSPVEKSYQLGLKKGMHKFKLSYFQGRYGKLLEFTYQVNQGERSAVGSDQFYHK